MTTSAVRIARSDRRPRRRVTIAALVLLAAGCGSLASGVRRITYPPDFRYIEHSQLEAAMWRLAFHVEQMGELLRRDAPPTEAERAEIVAHLREMEVATAQLRRDGTNSNHPMLDQHLDSFGRDLTLARAHVEHEPPNYILAGAVSGACFGCHRAAP